MITFEERIQNIVDMVGEDDNDVLKERVILMYMDVRARLIRQSYSNNRMLDEEYMQVITLSTERVKSTLDAPYYVSKEKVPTPVRLKTSRSFIYVGDIDMNIPYEQTKIEAFRYIQYNRYSSRRPRYAYHNDRIHVINSMTSKLLVKGVFYDFREAIILNDGSFSETNTEIATPGDISDIISDMIVDKIKKGLLKEYPEITVDDPERRT
tara:strand:+ start:676 stop:1302 length:627 start_codon:yes stop_codon:yes gene_type:complete